jgi:hypothetical protein
MLDAQTITHGLNDSPVGLLAWILQRWKKWSDQSVDFNKTFTKDEILTHATMMTEVLGYEQYAASGSDYGALITSQLGHKYAASLYGIHLGQDLLPAFFLNQERPWDLTEGHMVPKDAPEDQRNWSST